MKKTITNTTALLSRRTLTLCVGLAVCAWAFGVQAQSNYPVRPVRLIVGFPAGTGPDIVARILAQ